MSKVDMVREFHAACCSLPPHGWSEEHGAENRILRRKLITEEYREFIEAEYNNDIIAVADALADLLYVIYGTAIEYNLPIDAIFKEVHRSNMTKFKDGMRREDGKWMKGPSYEPPDIQGVLLRSK